VRAEPAKHLLFWLVVHGSFAPGGSDHHRLAELQGSWHAGSFSGVAGTEFSDLVLKRYQDEPVRGWALQLAPKPDKTQAASDELGNSASALFETWARIDEVFGSDVVRMDTTFHFDERQPAEGDVCRANTYGSLSMVPDGRYDAAHPGASLVELWANVVSGARCYDPSIFRDLITTTEPSRYGDVFGALPASERFVERLHTLDHDLAAGSDRDLAPQAPNAVDDETIMALAQQVIETKSHVIQNAQGASWAANGSLVRALDYRLAQPDERPELGDLHYDLAELFADVCAFTVDEWWTSCLAQACYSLGSSYDLVYWLTQAWHEAIDADLDPLYQFWKAGGSVAVDIEGVAHVSALHTR